MVIEGRIEIGPYAAGSKSARKHQVFLVTSDGERFDAQIAPFTLAVPNALN